MNNLTNTSLMNSVSGALPMVFTAGYVLSGVIAGRKVAAGVCCKATSVVANLVDSKTASDWSKAGDQYFSMFKKDAVRDITTAVGILALTAAADYAEDLLKVEPPKEEPQPEPEPEGYFTQAWNAVNNVYGAGIASGVGLVGGLAANAKWGNNRVATGTVDFGAWAIRKATCGRFCAPLAP